MQPPYWDELGIGLGILLGIWLVIQAIKNWAKILLFFAIVGAAVVVGVVATALIAFIQYGEITRAGMTSVAIFGGLIGFGSMFVMAYIFDG